MKSYLPKRTATRLFFFYLQFFSEMVLTNVYIPDILYIERYIQYVGGILHEDNIKKQIRTAYL